MQITPANPKIDYGGSIQLSVVFEPAGSKPVTPVVWESSNPHTASIGSSGVAGSVGFADFGGVGPTTITVRADGLSASTVLTVLPPPARIVIPQRAPGTFIGNPQPLTMVVIDVTNPDPIGQFSVSADSWSSSDPGVAIIDSSGLVTPVAPGTTALTATSGGATDSVVLEVWGTPARFVYVANASLNSISGFALSIGPSYALSSNYPVLQDFSELPQQVPNLPVGAGDFPATLATDPSGKFLFAANFRSNDVSVYSIDASTGSLAAAPGSPFASGTAPASVAVDASGAYLYVLNSAVGNVSAYSIEGNVGVLTELSGSPFAVGSSPTALLAGAGGILYVVNGGADSLSVFKVNPANGVLSEVAGSPFTTGKQPSAVAEYAGGNLVYVTNQASNSVSGFIRDGSGNFTEIAGSPFPLYATPSACPGDQPLAIAVDPQVPALFVTMKARLASCNGLPLETYQIDRSTGALTNATTGNELGAVGPQNAVTVDSSGRVVWVVDSGSQSLLQYNVATRWGLAMSGFGSVQLAGAAPTAVVVVK